MSPTGLKKPLLKLNRLIGHSAAKNHISKLKLGDVAALEDPKEHKDAEKAKQDLIIEQEKQQEKDEIRQRAKEREESAHSSDPPSIRSHYGTTTEENSVLGCEGETWLAALHDNAKLGTAITIVVRLHHVRSISSRLAFLVFRQQLDSLQGVLACRDDVVSENFVRWAEHLSTESLIRVSGTLQEPKEPVTGCSIHNIELLVDTIHVLVGVEDNPPLDVYTIDRVEKDEQTNEITYVHPTHTRMANRISYLRTPTMQGIMRINATICDIFRSTLTAQGFMEIHTPKLQPAATESGAEVFEVKYFGRKAFLAQSPQLAKQLCMAADFGRVFEIGSVFRAENSNTHRHLTEYVSLDLEMVIKRDYYDAMSIIDNLLKSILRGVYERNRKEIEVVKTHFPHEDLIIPDKTLVLPFKDAVGLLNASGWTDDQGNEASPTEDLSTPAEIQLGQVIKEKYNTDYYIIDKFPRSARPFYTHLDKNDSNYTNSFDIFLRGQEITTGGQRIHDARTLKKRMVGAGIDPSDMEEYLHGFEWGVLPHAGCGIGLERLVFLMLGLKNVRNATLFPRDPKSLPAKPLSTTPKLTHPEADTIQYAIDYENWEDSQGGEQPPAQPSVEDLIANYGDATNTSWLDDRYQVWRHKTTGAAIGFAEESGYALIMGNPLCDSRQYALVISAFLRDLRSSMDLRPLWLLVSAEVEQILGTKLGWNTLSCVAEERVRVNGNEAAAAVKKKRRHAEDAGVTTHVLDRGKPVPDEFRKRCDKRIEDWKAKRMGKQVHITEVRPWIDLKHRRFVWAEDREGNIAALVILHDLSPVHGCQIKFALDFPGSPPGSIELAIAKAISLVASSSSTSSSPTITFGAGATRDLLFGEHLDGSLRAKILSQTYRTVAEQLKLYQKSDFRDKFGAEEDAVYICYPHMGLGVSGTRTLIKFFEDEM
ncbi:aspartate--tRNA ligase dps1 [Sporothrix bragantina]|uniref:aspartate--tRNA ligase n=1 Tax=Sporothrix bragantina TaxID=671064 RepID=A0ABP0AWM9_9PEZI